MWKYRDKIKIDHIGWQVFHHFFTLLSESSFFSQKFSGKTLKFKTHMLLFYNMEKFLLKKRWDPENLWLWIWRNLFYLSIGNPCSSLHGNAIGIIFPETLKRLIKIVPLQFKEVCLLPYARPNSSNWESPCWFYIETNRPLYRACRPDRDGWVGGCQPWGSVYSGSR